MGTLTIILLGTGGYLIGMAAKKWIQSKKKKK